MVDEDFGYGDDVDFSAIDVPPALPAEPTQPAPAPPTATTPSRPPPPTSSSGPIPVQQPKPQALPTRGSGSAILVSTRQKGNPVLKHIKAVPWEYAETPADYVVGATTCALFLSLKYHRLHPEYIYARIKQLQGKFNLRILLTMVDIENHEESLKELTKTSVINNVTIILAWSAWEAGRYLEMYKIYEHTPPTSIKKHQSTDHIDRLMSFITVPRGINKTDALGLVSNFGSLRTAINARPEEIALLAGWGETKVKRWCHAVREPFRSAKAQKRTLVDFNKAEGEATEPSRATKRPAPREPDADEQEASATMQHSTSKTQSLVSATAAASSSRATSSTTNTAPSSSTISSKKRAPSPEMSEGVMAALAKLRENT